ncbi:serine hydrolase domain-containing protein [Massilia sp. DD77]|uniref:serine hydrolase domain-containing protein n=1 Tax=Massilia sp. DD77 TaxID=3109349 RepID=UPI002FFE6C92
MHPERLIALFRPRTAVLAAALCASFVPSVPAWADDSAAITRIERNLASRVMLKGAPGASLADEMKRLNVPGVSVAVIRGGKLAWARAYGVAYAGGPAVTPETLFQAASVSKPVTALAAMRMVEGGKLALDADINNFLTSWKLPAGPEGAKASLRQLLSHTAGTSVSGFPGYAAGAPLPTVLQILGGQAPANNKPVRIEAAPGAAWNYSGGGYTVVQQAMADTAGKPFDVLLAESVLKPLGMRDSTFAQPLPAAMKARAAQPHDGKGQPYPGGAYTHPEMAAAGLWTTPSDVARFALAVQDIQAGRLKGVLSAELARTMLTPIQRNYGLGFGIEGQAPRQAFGHTGANKGFRSSMLASFDGDNGVIVMTNGDNGGQLAASLERAVAIEYGWPVRQPKVREAVALSPEVRKTYVGRYESPVLGGFEIAERDGTLALSMKGGPFDTLHAESDKVLFMLERDAELRFEDANGGRIVGGPLNAPYKRVSL